VPYVVPCRAPIRVAPSVSRRQAQQIARTSPCRQLPVELLRSSTYCDLYGGTFFFPPCSSGSTRTPLMPWGQGASPPRRPPRSRRTARPGGASFGVLISPSGYYVRSTILAAAGSQQQGTTPSATGDSTSRATTATYMCCSRVVY
jgi:hypothetical protein